MPLYAYRCPDCGHDFDDRRPIAERDSASCPVCGAAGRRLLATVSAVGRAPEPACGGDVCATRRAAGAPCTQG